MDLRGRSARALKDSVGLVAWAMYAEGVIKMTHQHNNSNKKLEKWRSTNGPCLASERKLNVNNLSNYSDSTTQAFIGTHTEVNMNFQGGLRRIF